MAPLQDHVPTDFRPPHQAIAFTIPMVTDRTLYYGYCARGDFESAEQRVTKAEAEADVNEHLADVQAHPHRPRVRILRGSTPRYLGSCDASDFTASELRDSWAEAADDVAAHVAAMHQDQSQ